MHYGIPLQIVVCIAVGGAYYGHQPARTVAHRSVHTVIMGLAGLFHKQKYGFFTGTVAGCVARFLVAYIVGATIWAEYMPETFFGMTMTTPWFYSALYNGSYMLIDMILCLAVGALIWKPLGKYIRGEDLAAK